MGVLSDTSTNVLPSSITANTLKRATQCVSRNPCKKLRLDFDGSITNTNAYPEPPLSPPSSSNAGKFLISSAVHANSDSDDDLANATALIRHRRGSANRLAAHRRRKSVAVPESDKLARQACFDYLVSAIDEVWAQYCACTSSAENDRYDETNPRTVDELPNSPVSLCGEEDDDYTTDEPSCPGTPGYRKHSIVADGNPATQPLSVRLLNLKKRLMNAKYFLQDLVDSSDPVSSAEFWTRWDMIKYATIDLVEEDGDEDDIVESVTEDLENGRYYNNRY